MTQNRPEAHVIKLGGSLIVPDGGINVPFLKEFNAFIRRQVTERGRRFFLFVGGGRLARHYRDAGAEITGHELASDDLDWLGVHATRLNAHLFRTIFRDIAHPAIIKDYSYIHKPEKPVVIAAGWRPGWSTDYVAAVLAQDYHIKTIVKMSNTDFIMIKILVQSQMQSQLSAFPGLIIERLSVIPGNQARMLPSIPLLQS